MRDPSGIIFAVVVFFGVALTFIVLVALRRKSAARASNSKSDELARKEREEQIKLRKLLDAGTHVLMPHGVVAPKCYGCDSPAKLPPRRWRRDVGVWDLIRRKFGAPAKVRVDVNEFAEPVSCEACVGLLDEEFRLEIADQETDRAKLESEHETRRARFERVGVYERAKAKIAKHEREIGGRKRSTQKSEAQSKVVPFVSSGRTGTDSK